MQKFTKFALSLMMILAATVAKADVVYSWESPEGTVIEQGGTIEYVNGENLADETKPTRLNYKNGDYYTICLNGKKANLADETPSANAGHMVITFNDELKAGDEIVMTAYYNKGEAKNVSAWLVFENGTALGSARVTSDIALGATPENITVVVPADADGSKTLTLTRNDAGTNMFITKLVVNGERSASPKIGTPVFNVADETIAVTTGYLEANGIVLTFDGAEGITPDMQIKVVADLYTAVPGYGVADGEDGAFNHTGMQVVKEDVEFTGDAMFGVPTVSMTEFTEEALMAGEGSAFGIVVKSIVVSSEETVLATWRPTEDDFIQVAFEVVAEQPSDEVVLGEPVFNVADESTYGKFDLNELLVNGITLSFPEAQNVTPETTIKVVADLYTTTPGYGVGFDGDNMSAPDFQVVLDSVEFIGDAAFGTPIVYFTEFMQYIAEAGAGAYAINVHSIEVVDENELDLYAWHADEESPVFAVAFEVTEKFRTEEVTATVNLTEANEYGDQNFTVTLAVEADVFAGLGVAKAYCPEGITFEPNTVDEPAFTFMPAELNGIEVAEEENIEFHCNDYMVAVTTDADYANATRTEGTYSAYSTIVLTDADDNELGTAEFRGTVELVVSATGIKNVKFNVENVKFNLAGQRVNNANGIVIMNGKKVVLK